MCSRDDGATVIFRNSTSITHQITGLPRCLQLLKAKFSYYWAVHDTTRWMQLIPGVENRQETNYLVVLSGEIWLGRYILPLCNGRAPSIFLGKSHHVQRYYATLTSTASSPSSDSLARMPSAWALSGIDAREPVDRIGSCSFISLVHQQYAYEFLSVTVLIAMSIGWSLTHTVPPEELVQIYHGFNK